MLLPAQTHVTDSPSVNLLWVESLYLLMQGEGPKGTRGTGIIKELEAPTIWGRHSQKWRHRTSYLSSWHKIPPSWALQQPRASCAGAELVIPGSRGHLSLINKHSGRNSLGGSLSSPGCPLGET
ncbi:hypothetical protein KIL84_009536 [Mauremys mutica]|uniref:Uncharacterized protein n=1 Tax=Mauremys mutica TaxID=74926 RepID=A0A9D3WNX8_9SAUR|nr:hypothetical protein KIL84_009536 [Mauremys mutica]